MAELLPVIDTTKKEYPLTYIKQEERNTVHDNGEPHITTLIMPLIKADNGKYDILTVNKYKKDKIKTFLRGKDFDDTKKLRYDIFGGHLTMNDLTDKEKSSMTVTFDTVCEQAYRELCEELKMYNAAGNITLCDRSDLLYLGDYTYRDKYNYEISSLFCFIVPNDAVKFVGADDYIEYDEKKDILLETQTVTLSYLSELYKNPVNDIKICDGLERLFYNDNSIKEIISNTYKNKNIFIDFN